jgi:MFS family permease
MALPPAVLVSLSPNLNKIGVRVGMALTIGSLGVLVGSPVAGAILSRQSKNGNPDILGSLNYTGTLIFTGIALFVCAVLMSATRVIKKGVKLEKI